MVQTFASPTKMTPENFCYWLQGLFELQPDLKSLTPEQIAMIRQHLMYVFDGKVAVPLPVINPIYPNLQPQFEPPIFTPHPQFLPQKPDELTVIC